MMCERYWRDGILLVERGLDDPHRDGCIDCRRAHTSRDELVAWLPLVGAGRTGDPSWQANVWQRIDGPRTHARSRWAWQVGGALAVACAVLLWIGVGLDRVADAHPEIVIESGPKRMRATEAHIGDGLRFKTVRKAAVIRIYRADALVRQCVAGQASNGCVLDGHDTIAEKVLSIRGEYTVLVIDVPLPAALAGDLDGDRAALLRARVEPILDEPVPVR